MRHKGLWFGFGGILLFLVIGTVGFFIWISNPQMAESIALSSLETDSLINVQTDRWLVFKPRNQPLNTGFILYPGGLVDPKAYAPNARAIASHGFLVVIPPMPLNLAVFGVNSAADIIAAYPDISHWAIGGHSLGGSMAATFSYRNPEKVDGLVLWAAYPPENNDLSSTNLVVASIYGTQDGVVDPDKVVAASSLLPLDTTWVPIEGGNHAQFGFYGPQNGDYPATISHESQAAQIVKATVMLLSQLDG